MNTATITTTPGIDPMPRPIWSKARENDKRPWTAAEDQTVIDVCSMGICPSHSALKQALPHRRFGDILERRQQLKEAGLLRAPAPL